MQQMNENSPQTIKELSGDKEIQNSPELDNNLVSQNEENFSFEKNDIPSADSSSSRKNTDFDNALSKSVFFLLEEESAEGISFFSNEKFSSFWDTKLLSNSGEF